MNVREIFLHHALGVTPKALKTVVSNTHIQTTGENFMKKSLIAAALLGTFAASAFAAPSVTLYGRIDIMIDKGPAARSVQIQINPFTLIGATTRSGLLTAPLRARFGINCHLEYYDTDILSGIISRSAAILNVGITGQAAMEIASRSRGTPRIANALLRRVRDFAMVKGNGSIDRDITRYALEALNIDKYGLDEMDNKILLTIIEKFKGGPVGLTTIATAVGEDAGTLEEVYEPFLIKEGFIKRTPRGREVTDLAYKHLGKTRRNDGGEQMTLF